VKDLTTVLKWSNLSKLIKWILFGFLVASGLLVWQTAHDLLPPPNSLSVIGQSPIRKMQILDRHAVPLTMTYQNDWNLYDIVSLHEIPVLLQKILVVAEDQHFFEHGGVDWLARGAALLQNVKLGRKVRGASTITEQVVRLLHPRPRTVWSRWLEGFEAVEVEKYFSKAEILEFYLNQVPYAGQRRGVVQAARYYFDRDVDTLNLKEMMALAVMVRAPSRLSLRQNPVAIEAPIQFLASRLLSLGVLTEEDYQTVLTSSLVLRDNDLPVKATHFAQYLYASTPRSPSLISGKLLTTLDGQLQRTVQDILDRRLQDLRRKGVNNGAVLVVDHETNEVLAWVNGGSKSHQEYKTHREYKAELCKASLCTPEFPGSQIDAILTPRQPGSTLKPFLYALALEKGWTPATLIEDAPLMMPVGTGLHNYRNYSRHYYGPLRLRQALANSLNTPAIRTIQWVGAGQFLQRLHQLGMSSLTADTEFYGEGLALGNGAVTLFELVQAYTVLAQQGWFRPLQVLKSVPTLPPRRVFSQTVTSLIADILSDGEARSLEFGRGALLKLPVQTAVKTGTSTDYRDAWAVGFNHHYTVGVWLGNLDQQSMTSISGASGAALVLRAVFAEVNRFTDSRRLYLSPELVKVTICRDTGSRAEVQSICPTQPEWFIAGTEPGPATVGMSAKVSEGGSLPLHLKQPSEGLQLAMDPRIPDDHEAFAWVLSETVLPESYSLRWLVDGEVVAITPTTVRQWLWPLTQGTHLAQVQVWSTESAQPVIMTPTVTFYVK